MSTLHIIILGLIFLTEVSQSEYSGKVLLISMDGFRYDYLDRVKHKPNFDRMVKEGVKAPYINNPFTTLTFPSHYTLVTGLYEENHGIVGRTFYDPKFNETFDMETAGTESKWWSGGEPIWITARKQGKKSGCYFWTGSEVELQGLRPNYYKQYKESTVFRDRVDEVTRWFTTNDVDVATLYFFEPDSTGHEYGPFSDQVLSKIEDLDAVLGYLLDTFEREGILDDVNIILTSDHGMTSQDPEKQVIDIRNYLTGNTWDWVNMVPTVGAICHVIPVANRTLDVYNALKKAHPNMTVYLKEDIPERYHYKNNDRVPPILIVADEGWSVTHFIPKYWSDRGGHGYDNELMSMKPFFLARGPNFKPNFKTPPFDSVDIYPLMCRLVGISPAPNNGSLDVVEKFVRDTPREVPTGNSVGSRFWVFGFSYWLAIVLTFGHLQR